MCICANVSLYCETGECKEYMKRYMKCLRENNNGNHLCRTESKDYLQCRMDRYICFPIFIPVKDLFLNSFWKGEPKNEMILTDELQYKKFQEHLEGSKNSGFNGNPSHTSQIPQGIPNNTVSIGWNHSLYPGFPSQYVIATCTCSCVKMILLLLFFLVSSDLLFIFIV